MRNVSLQGLQSLVAEETASVWVFAISIHPNDDDPNQYEPNYFVANTQDVTFANQMYLALPFELSLAADNEESAPQARLKIDNVSRLLSEAVRQTNFAPTIYVRLFRIDENNVVHLELGPSRFNLLSASVNAQTVEGVLGYSNDFLNEPASHAKFTPSVAPALFS
jgi:hypothetical protein